MLKALFVFFLVTTSTFAQDLELHSHAFMKHGLGILFRGDFESPVKSKSWKSLLSSNLNEQTLLDSDVRVFVVALYTNPIMKVFKKDGMRESIRKQIKQANDFVNRHPDWHLAKNAKQAHKFYLEGKKIMVLSIEGAHGVLETEDDFKEFIDELGISIVTPIHLTDTKLGGSAYMRGFRKTFFTTKIFTPLRSDGVRINYKGATDYGLWLVEELIKRGVWIDLTHSSDLFQDDVMPILKKYNHPLLFTHTTLRKYYRAERALSKKAIERIQELGGLVGLVPSEEMLIDTSVPNENCPVSCPECRGGSSAFVAQWNELAAQIGPDKIGLGSDFNGGITHLRPDKCEPLNQIDQKAGFYLFSQIPLLWEKVRTLRINAPRSMPSSTETFFRLWGQVQKIQL